MRNTSRERKTKSLFPHKFPSPQIPAINALSLSSGMKKTSVLAPVPSALLSSVLFCLEPQILKTECPNLLSPLLVRPLFLNHDPTTPSFNALHLLPTLFYCNTHAIFVSIINVLLPFPCLIPTSPLIITHPLNFSLPASTVRVLFGVWVLENGKSSLL